MVPLLCWLCVAGGEGKLTVKPHSTGFESTWHTCWLIENEVEIMIQSKFPTT